MLSAFVNWLTKYTDKKIAQSNIVDRVNISKVC
jgi:hypothetical protein